MQRAVDAYKQALVLEPQVCAPFHPLQPSSLSALPALLHSSHSFPPSFHPFLSFPALPPRSQAAAAYAGLGSALKQIDPKGAAEAFAAAARGEGGGKEAEEAEEVKKWLDAAPPRLPSARASPREWSTVAAEGVYPAAFEGRAKACARMEMAEAVAMGSEKLLALGPTLLNNATVGWQLQQWSDAALTAEVRGACHVSLAVACHA